MTDTELQHLLATAINYTQLVPALIEAGVDVLCIDSSEGFSEWQKRALHDIHNTFLRY